jgi:hypothetical protein
MKNEPAGKRPAGGWLGPRPVAEGLRRGRDISGSRPAVEIYGWQVREKPLSIKIPIDIVERLQDDIQYGLGMRTPCDVMGLLIGRVVKEYSSTITIQDYVLAGYTSESVGSRLWSNERLADMIKPWSKLNSSTYVVGLFRSQSEEWPEIAKEDLKGAKKLLRRTPNVFLLIRSGLSRSYAGRLFLRPSWRGKLDEEYGEFPLNADILRSQWDATAPKRDGPSLHFVPGNPLQGKQRPEPPRYIQDAVEAVFEPVMPSNEEVLAEASIQSVAVPVVEMLFQESIEELEVAKPSFWAKLFRRAEQEAPAFDVADAATQPETPDVQPVAAASVVEISDPSMEPAKRNLWTKLFRRPTVETLGVEPIAINNASETASLQPSLEMHSDFVAEVPATEEVCAEPAEAMHSEIAAELSAMQETTPSALDSRPTKQSLWAKLFSRTTQDAPPAVAEPTEAMHSEIAAELPAMEEAPSIEPVAAEPIPVNNAWDTPWTQAAEAVQSEMVAPASEQDTRPAKQSLWAELFHSATEDAAPLVAAPAEALQSEMIAPASEPDARPAKQSLWAKLFHRTSEEAAPVVAQTAEAMQSEIAAELPAMQETTPSIETAAAEPIPVTNAWDTPWTQPAEALQSEIAAELPAMQETTPSIEPAAAERIPVTNAWDTPWTQPAEAMQSEMVAPASELDARPAKQSLWAKLFHRTPEEAARVQPIAINSPWYMQEAPSIEPVAEASALEAPSSSPDPAQLSLWSKLFRPAEDEVRVEPVAESQPLDTPWADADEVMATEEAWEEAEPAKRSIWAKLFRRATDETPHLEAVPSNDEWDASSTEPTEAMQSEVSDEYPEEFESDGEAEPSKPGLWARLFRPTTEHPTPAEPERQSEGESIEEQPLQAAAFGDNPPPPSRMHSWLAVAATWIVAVGVTMWVISGRGPFSQRRPEVTEIRPVVVANPIGLQVDSAGGLLEIAWDPISVAAMTSSGGFLTIRDGNLLKEVRLDSGEIRSGHLYYGPRNPDLGIRLEVARDDGSTARESVRVVGPPAKGRSSDR